MGELLNEQEKDEEKRVVGKVTVQRVLDKVSLRQDSARAPDEEDQNYLLDIQRIEQ